MSKNFKAYHEDIWEEYKDSIDHKYSGLQKKVAGGFNKKINLLKNNSFTIEDAILLGDTDRDLRSFDGIVSSGYFHLSVTTNKDRFLINNVVPTLPFSKVDDAILVHKYDNITLSIMGYKRAQVASKMIDEFSSFYDTKSGEDLYPELLKTANRSVNEYQKIWEDVNDSKALDIFETIDQQQKEIIKDVDKPLNATIHGFAGTGKTIVGYELANLLSTNFRVNCVFIVPNKFMVNQAKNSMPHFLEDNKIIIKTYDELEQEIKLKLIEYMQEQLSFEYKDDFKDVIYNGVRISGLLNIVLSRHKKTFYKVQKNMLDKLGFLKHIYCSQLKKYFVDLSGNIIKEKISKLWEMIRKPELTWLLENSFMTEILKNKLLLRERKILIAEQVFMDEAPLILKYSCLKEYIESLNFKTIKIYDKYQYSVEEYQEMSELFKDDREPWNLDVVYRTTKEIFEEVVPNGVEENEYNAKISFENSFSVVSEPEEGYPTIKFSDVLKNPGRWIGREVEGLNLILDVAIDEKMEHITYMIATRARKKLNIISEQEGE